MANYFKYNTSPTGYTLINNNTLISGLEQIEYGPTRTTNYIPGPNNSRYYSIILEKNNKISNVFAPTNSSELLNLAWFLGASKNSVNTELLALQWFQEQPNTTIMNKMVLSNTINNLSSYNNLPFKLLFYGDASLTTSFTKTGNNTFKDLSGNNISGSCVNNCGLNTSYPSMYFSGSNANLNLTNNSVFNLTTTSGFTICLEIKPEFNIPSIGKKIFLSKNNNSNNGEGAYEINMGDGNRSLTYKIGGVTMNGTISLTSGYWYKIYLVFNQNGGVWDMYAYVNGRLDCQSINNITVLNNTTGNLTIGAYSDGSNGIGFAQLGVFKIFNANIGTTTINYDYFGVNNSSSGYTYDVSKYETYYPTNGVMTNLRCVDCGQTVTIIGSSGIEFNKAYNGNLYFSNSYLQFPIMNIGSSGGTITSIFQVESVDIELVYFGNILNNNSFNVSIDYSLPSDRFRINITINVLSNNITIPYTVTTGYNYARGNIIYLVVDVNPTGYNVYINNVLIGTVTFTSFDSFITSPGNTYYGSLSGNIYTYFYLLDIITEPIGITNINSQYLLNKQKFYS